MNNQLVVTCVILVASIGCAYAHGMIDYSEHPELRTIRLYTGVSSTEGTSLATVEAIAEGQGTCTEVSAGALRQLLDQARAIGGDGVKDVMFRGRWNWMGRVVCRRGIAKKSAQVRGMAFKIESGEP